MRMDCLKAGVPTPQEIMSFRMAAGPAHDLELECIRRFGRDVIPAFR
jgi:hypothetical protein